MSSAVKPLAYFFSTVGRKQTMAIAGIVWSLFVVGHAAGNLLMFVSPEIYNKYGHAIVSNPALYLIEAILVFTLLVHAVVGIVLAIQNKRARGSGYAKAATGEKKTSWVTKTMWAQGLVILGFIVLHLLTFKFGPEYEITYDGVVIRDLFRLVHEVFQSPAYVYGYILVMLVLCFHLAHGVQSSLQTLGLNHPKYTPKIQCISVAYGCFVAMAFVAQPIYMMYFYNKG